MILAEARPMPIRAMNMYLRAKLNDKQKRDMYLYDILRVMAMGQQVEYMDRFSEIGKYQPEERSEDEIFADLMAKLNTERG